MKTSQPWRITLWLTTLFLPPFGPLQQFVISLGDFVRIRAKLLVAGRMNKIRLTKKPYAIALFLEYHPVSPALLSWRNVGRCMLISMLTQAPLIAARCT